MSEAIAPGRQPAGPRAGVPLLDHLPLALVAGAFLVLYLPLFADLARVVWSTDEQGQGPALLALAIWTAWRKLPEVQALPKRPAPVWGWPLFAFGLLLQWVGRTQDVLMFSTFSLIPLLAGLLLATLGTAALKRLWFPLFFLLFVIPLPGPLVAALTSPLKQAVSYVATLLLGGLGYPVARSGVVLMVGPYQLLVADACAGLTSMFTLEALGMLYMNLRGHASAWRNGVLAVLLVPVSFTANVVRVLLLVLVTYHFGDAAGRGFVHASAGVLLFAVAIGLMLIVDSLLGAVLFRTGEKVHP